MLTTESPVSMSAQVSAVCRTGYYQLRQLRPLVRCLSEDAVKTVIQAFINTRLDYCNSLYFGIADGLMSRLQSVQNAAARLVTGVRRCEHITPVSQSYVSFKISTLVYRSLAGTAPVYLADECTLVTTAGRRPLQSADSRTCVVKRSRNQFGDRSFVTAGPTLWNSLPEQFRQPGVTFRQLKRLLKTFMFG